MSASNASSLERYYRFHAHIYDATRWSFLFGRNKIIQLTKNIIQPKHILEVGCGTGKNIVSLTKAFPKASLTGIDLSTDMLAVAEKKLRDVKNSIQLTEKKYETPLKGANGQTEKYDLILFSYALSMFNPGWERAIYSAREQLSEKGCIAVVDFHTSPSKNFRRWMQVNHVHMEGHLLPVLESQFTPIVNQTNKAYSGVWKYLFFVGQKK